MILKTLSMQGASVKVNLKELDQRKQKAPDKELIHQLKISSLKKTQKIH